MDAKAAGEAPIPIVQSLDQIYSNLSLVREDARWKSLCSKFSDLYGQNPEWVARAPGRVNIIGEHIDYSLFSVLPAAIEADVLIAIRARPSPDSNVYVHLVNVESKYDKSSFSFNPANGSDGVVIDNKKLDWANYFKCGLKGLLTSIEPPKPVILEALVWGTVPAGSGLSSSAALTTASATASARAFGISDHISRKKLTEIAIISEQWAGVFSGGMDQAASVFGMRDYLTLIDFVPSLLATPVPLPKTQPPVSLVIAHSLVVADKHKTSKYNYNLRVVECRLATILLAKHLNVEPETQTLKGVMDAYFKQSQGTPQEHMTRLRKMLEIVETLFGQNPKGETWDHVLNDRLGGITREQFEKDIQRGIEIECQVFNLYSRSKHVYEEAIRVYEFLLKLTDKTETVNAKELGDLLNQSQDSCRDQYNISCPEINDLITISLNAGALGGRITGAGFGGCTVHMVPEDIVDNFIATLKEKYYANLPAAKNLSEQEIEAACFATKPGAGAVLYKTL